MPVDGSLLAWTSVESQLVWKDAAILLGNGASISVSPRFSYKSLFAIASDTLNQSSLPQEIWNVFVEFDTENFEEILYNLIICGRTCKSLSLNPTTVCRLRKSYDLVKEALLVAVRNTHPGPQEISSSIKAVILQHLIKYKNIYTTNYDMLVFWALAAERRTVIDRSGRPQTLEFKDFFWTEGGVFDPADTDIWHGAIGVHFLHGGLHLYYKRDTGATYKHGALNELPLVYFEHDSGLLPLFVSEGDSRSKLRSIRRNEYLSFVYSRLRRHSGDLVVFGHSLNADFDGHIVDAIRTMFQPPRRPRRTTPPVRRRVLAISIHPSGGREWARQEQHRIYRQLNPDAVEILFFDSTTHPLSHQT